MDAQGKTNQEVPTGSEASVEQALRKASLSRALHQVVREVNEALTAQEEVPALARHLAKWLEDANVADLSDSADDLSLVRAIHYSDLYYIVASQDAPLHVSGNDIAAMECALDTYKLVLDVLGDASDTADMQEVSYAANLVRTIIPPFISQKGEAAEDAQQTGEQVGTGNSDGVNDAGASDGFDRSGSETPFDLPVCDSSVGEWGWRRNLSVALESIRSPHRIVVDFQGSLQTGTVTMVGLVPSVNAMPKSVWNAEANNWRVLSYKERHEMAVSYSLSCAIACVAAAFASSDRIQRVKFLEGFIDSKAMAGQGDGRGFVMQSCCRIDVDRASFVRDGIYVNDGDDPLACWISLGGNIIIDAPVSDMVDGWSDALELLQEQFDESDLPSRSELPEFGDGRLPETVGELLGVRYARDMRIMHGSLHRRNAENLADRLAAAETDVERVRLARAMQSPDADPFDVQAANRVMSSLLSGDLDTADQNAVVNCYLGEDEYLKALSVSRELMAKDRDKALESLLSVVDQAEQSGLYADDLEVVHRGFDSYSSRLMYNLVRTGTLKLSSERFDYGANDAGKRVELIPDALYLCYTTAGYGAEQQFDGFESGEALSRTAIRMAPTVPNGYRQLARAYSLVGDMDSAAKVLFDALQICVTPADIALVYYQLGYVLWKAGRPQAGALCYLKSVTTSPVVAAQAAAELRGLMHEERIPVVGRPEIDEGLKDEGIPLAPLPHVIDAIMDGAEAAVDAGMFGVARSLLNVGLHYRPDDALFDVLKSLAGN